MQEFCPTYFGKKEKKPCILYWFMASILTKPLIDEEFVEFSAWI